MFAHDTADRILVGLGLWLCAVSLLVLIVAQMRKPERPVPDVALTPEETFEQHVLEALYLASLPLAERVAAEKAPGMVREIEQHLKEVAS